VYFEKRASEIRDAFNKKFLKEGGVQVSLGLILLIKPSSLGFTVLRIPFSSGSIS
jgi:hypothetical protein